MKNKLSDLKIKTENPRRNAKQIKSKKWKKEPVRDSCVAEGLFISLKKAKVLRIYYYSSSLIICICHETHKNFRNSYKKMEFLMLSRGDHGPGWAADKKICPLVRPDRIFVPKGHYFGPKLAGFCRPKTGRDKK